MSTVFGVEKPETSDCFEKTTGKTNFSIFIYGAAEARALI
jgi:hypothetical protein